MTVSSPSVTIGIAMHKPYRTPEDPAYLPIHVGAAQHPDVLMSIVQDNSLDNISDLNPYFSELTALYWLWKNNDSDYKALVHYRRYFASKTLLKRFSKDRFGRIASGAELMRMMQNTDVLVPIKQHYYIETIESHYEHTHYKEHLGIMRQILIDMEPGYVQAWDKVLHERGAHFFNMMVMSKATFNAYCEWLFPLLFEMVKRHDPSCYDPFQARYPGRISEILLNVWLEANQINYKTLPTIYTETINWPRKIFSFLKAKMVKQRYSASF